MRLTTMLLALAITVTGCAIDAPDTTQTSQDSTLTPVLLPPAPNLALFARIASERKAAADLRALAAAPPPSYATPTDLKGLHDLAVFARDSADDLDTDIAMLEDAINASADVKDSVSELSQEQQLRMQMTMDRQEKFYAMLSNILKKFSDTERSIIDNIK